MLRNHFFIRCAFQVVIDEDDKFLKLLELLGIYQEQGKPKTCYFGRETLPIKNGHNHDWFCFEH